LSLANQRTRRAESIRTRFPPLFMFILCIFAARCCCLCVFRLRLHFAHLCFARNSFFFCMGYLALAQRAREQKRESERAARIVLSAYAEVYMCMCVCVCVSIRECQRQKRNRERERERGRAYTKFVVRRRIRTR